MSCGGVHQQRKAVATLCDATTAGTKYSVCAKRGLRVEEPLMRDAALLPQQQP